MIISQNDLSISLEDLSTVANCPFFPVFRIDKMIKCVDSPEGPKLIYDRSVSVSSFSEDELKLSCRRAMIRFACIFRNNRLLNSNVKENLHLNSFAMKVFKKNVSRNIRRHGLNSMFICMSLRIFYVMMDSFFGIGSIQDDW